MLIIYLIYTQWIEGEFFQISWRKTMLRIQRGVCKAWIRYSHPTSQTAANLGFFQKPHRFLLFSLYSTPSVSETRREIHTMLDINLFRVEKGGNPEIIRESQRRRFANVDIVDEIIAIDKQWRQRISHSLSLSVNFATLEFFFFIIFGFDF